MDRKALPVGVDIFAHLITNDYYYVDKTEMIKDLLDKKGAVNLFTRPRRFGKTLNMTMLQYFFEDMRDRYGNKLDNRGLFDGLRIMQAGEKYTAKMGQYPVIFLSFKEAKQPDFQGAFEEMKRAIGEEYDRHRYVLESEALFEEDKDKYRQILRLEASDSSYRSAIKFLARCLEQYYGKKVIILIDEYDVPLENAFVRHFYDEMVSLIRTMFGAALKTNPSLEFAVITGCLRISKESIFTGLNNLTVVSILSTQYDEYFGFTEEEVKEMCTYYGLADKYPLMKEWYDGYVFGDSDVYNPWSVIRCLYDLIDNSNSILKAYWANTSSNSIVRTLIDRADESVKSEIETLISGGTIEKPVHEDITYGEIYDDMDSLWNFMFFTGYFRKVGERFDDIEKTSYLTLTIPNFEVETIFRKHIRKWFEQRIKQRDLSVLHKAFLHKDVSTLQAELTNILEGTISSADEQENYYHGLVAGLLTGVKGYITKSNRESGKGRCDLFVKPVDVTKEAFILEFKVTKAKGDTALETAADAALEQIADRHYDRELEDEYYTVISHYGIAFRGKQCLVKLAQ